MSCIEAHQLVSLNKATSDLEVVPSVDDTVYCTLGFTMLLPRGWIPSFISTTDW